MRFGRSHKVKGRSEKLKQPLLQVRNSPFESPFGPNEPPGRSKTKKGNTRVLPLLMQRYNFLQPNANAERKMLTPRPIFNLLPFSLFSSLLSLSRSGLLST